MADAKEWSLVPDRSCGTCVVCCYVPSIDTPELKKPAGLVCQNCNGKGCGIYETRPPVCRSYYCGWWYFAELRDDWRPDKSGVLIGTRSDLPTESGTSAGWQLTVFGGEVAIRRVGFVQMVVAFIKDAVPVMLAASGPMGVPNDAVILNPLLADLVKKNDLGGVLARLISIHGELLARAYKRASENSEASSGGAEIKDAKP